MEVLLYGDINHPEQWDFKEAEEYTVNAHYLLMDKNHFVHRFENKKAAYTWVQRTLNERVKEIQKAKKKLKSALYAEA